MDPIAELLARIERLEKRKISVKDLPLKSIASVLAKEPQDPMSLLLPKSVTPDLISDEAAEFVNERLGIAAGYVKVSFVASAFSGTVEVAHGLGVIPVVDLTGIKSGATFVFPNLVEKPTDSVFKVQATVNGGTLNTTVEIPWIAKKET